MILVIKLTLDKVNIKQCEHELKMLNLTSFFFFKYSYILNSLYIIKI